MQMMPQPKLKIYLETSVVSALFDERQPERKRLTETFWQELERYEPYISTLVQKELSDHPKERIRREMLDMVSLYPVLNASEGAGTLAQAYLKAGVIPDTHTEDAIHLATATLYNMDILVSWNYKHIVKLETVKKIQSLNVLQGYRPIDIVTPLNI